MHKLLYNIEKFKNNIALIDKDNKKYSYKNVVNLSKNISSKIKNKSLILLISSNSIESIIGYISFVRSNNITIILDKSFNKDFATEIVKRYKPNYIFSPKNYFRINGKELKLSFFKEYNLIKTQNKNHNKINKKNFILLSTSGTTHNPKFVRLSNANLYKNTNDIIKYLKINSKHSTLTTMPMGYSYGLSVINTHLSSGAKIVVSDTTIFERNFWEKIKKYKITSLSGVPQFYEHLKKLKIENFHLPFLKYLTQAGGKLEKSYLIYFYNFCKNKNLKFFVMYGQTEASPRMSYLNFNKLYKKMGSIGKPLNGAKFQILNKKGAVIKKSLLNGELVYFGKNVSLGYAYSLKDLKKGDINKGRLCTGDLGYKDKDGYYYLTGRKNRISKIFGIRIDLDDIEKKLSKEKFDVKCMPDNKFLKIETKKNYEEEDIKKIINNFYGINKNFIFINKVKNFSNNSNFKSIINNS